METAPEEIKDLATRLCTLTFTLELESCNTLEDFEKHREHYRELAKESKNPH